MEIPSSSPTYTPLGRSQPELGPSDYDLPQVELFPQASSPRAYSEPPSPMNTSGNQQPGSDDTAIETDTEDSSSHALELKSNSMDLRSQCPPEGHSETNDGHDPYIDSDNETTIFSDDDLTQSLEPAKNTQNYLEELLTESLLESLPLPPDRKLTLRQRQGET